MVRQKIFLGGFMAAGKTAVGRELARRLRLPFVDTDNLVEAQAHMEIHEIFFRHGEGAFRSLEAKVVEEVCSLEGVIVGLGGGVLANDELKRKVFSNGVLVVLDVTPDTVRRRVESQKGRRPLLEREDVESLMSRRQSAYAEAHLRVKTDDRSVEDVAEEIIRALGLNEPEEGSDFRVLWGRTEGRSYPVVVGRGVIPRYREIVPGLESVPPFLVSDYMTGALYADL
ncbi:MAG: 3-dehydroquinate synthase, partial [Synergistales bacterium]|nr:3-dehydroquinate synthase [Synergistales bacterium]